MSDALPPEIDVVTYLMSAVIDVKRHVVLLYVL